MKKRRERKAKWPIPGMPHEHHGGCGPGCAEMKGRMLELAAVLQREGFVFDAVNVGSLMSLAALYANRIGVQRDTFAGLMTDMWDESEETRERSVAAQRERLS